MCAVKAFHVVMVGYGEIKHCAGHLGLLLRLVHGGLSVACWTAKWEGWGSNPSQGRNFDQDFYFNRTPTPPLGTQIKSQAWNSPSSSYRGSRERQQKYNDTETEKKTGKDQDMEKGEGKALYTNGLRVLGLKIDR